MYYYVPKFINIIERNYSFNVYLNDSLKQKYVK